MTENEFILMAGPPVRSALYAELRERIETLGRQGITPGLATLIVGDDPASFSYVRGKVKSAKKLGISSVQENLPDGTSQENLLDLIARWNEDESIHGILVQMPLPPGYDVPLIQRSVALFKDVDGFHVANMGALAMKGEKPLFVPCTPLGIMRMLSYYGVDPQGKEAVVLGRSNIVGIPMALLLMHANATVTIAHSRTEHLAEVCSRADILVAAIGKPEFVRANMVKEGAVVVDVGINRVDDRLVGDVAFDEVKEKVKAISPVPKGVGPLTVAMLMHNLVVSAERKADD
jgi:methylenetetrahydrofolate dehydrogenase (NADP+)/methenyltetrahydrofolate cyclohydrolase